MTSMVNKSKQQKPSNQTHHTDTNRVSTSSPDYHIQTTLLNTSIANMTPETVMYLQRQFGNKAVNQLLNQQTATAQIQRTSHERGCNCPNCRKVQRSADFIQRDGGKKGKKTKSAQEKFKKAHVNNKKKMTALASEISVDEFKQLASDKGVRGDKAVITLIKYFSPLTLADLEPMISGLSAKHKKKLWSNSKIMTQAESKIGKDPYLTFITKLGMHHAPTTKELYEGGKEHTAAPEADKIIRNKLDAYVASAVKDDKKIEGFVAVVAGSDWDRAGIAHYGEDVWNTGPPPKTPKKDAINGFVDSSGRVWVERDSGNPGTIIHEGIHKYSDGAILSNLGFYINEGVTEYFTRVICKDLNIDRGNYDSQYAVIKKWVKVAASEELLAKAYFDGDIDGLKTAFIKYRTGTKKDKKKAANANWKTFTDKFSDGDYSDALDLLK